MKQMQKVTVTVPRTLLKNMMKYTNQGITGTLRKALEVLAANYAYEGILKMGGKMHLDIDLKSCRKDHL